MDVNESMDEVLLRGDTGPSGGRDHRDRGQNRLRKRDDGLVGDPVREYEDGVTRSGQAVLLKPACKLVGRCDDTGRGDPSPEPSECGSDRASLGGDPAVGLRRQREHVGVDRGVELARALGTPMRLRRERQAAAELGRPDKRGNDAVGALPGEVQEPRPVGRQPDGRVRTLNRLWAARRAREHSFDTSAIRLSPECVEYIEGLDQPLRALRTRPKCHPIGGVFGPI